MSLYCRIIQAEDLSELLHFEEKKMLELYPEETERMFASWNSRARKEALEHYLNLGWSFLARDPEQSSEFSDEGLLVGYFLGQPLLFFEGQTQSLWVEHLQYQSLIARDQLCDLAYRLAREKHFQRVLMPQHQSIQNSLNSYKPENWNPQAFSIKTTKA